MKKEAKKFLLFLLSIIMFVKRALVRFFLWIGMGFSLLNGVYERTIGPTLYQWLYTIRKKIPPVSLLRTGRIVGFFGRRSTLQALLFLVLFIIMIPQTRLYTAPTPLVPGQKTLLYSLVGPGEQDFGPIEEYIVEEATLVSETPDRSWRDGTVSADQVSPIGSLITEPADISAISMGGGAVTKPTILPGNELPVSSDPDKPRATGRTEVTSYVVQSGDTIGGIAEQFRISVATILWANNLTARSYIRPGDTLKILPVSGVAHTVARGDTVSSLSKTYDTEADQIIAFNKLQSDGSDIIIGETLVIPGGEKPEPKAVYTPVDRTYTALSKVAAPPPSVSAPAGSGYVWPTAARTITQYYGLHHTGMDIAGPVGTAVYATKSGTVIKSQDGWNGGYGNYIIIDHGGGITSLYGHNSVRYASLGEYVEQGQTIAVIGSTGRSTGPHLHFEIRVNNRHTNPLQYIR
jgi:murein DD-endopeptidase MepM/ murein hydrolase activator NlpD